MEGMNQPLILIVEDEKDIARFIELELQAEGYRTEVAYDGITGLSRFRETNPNLVIMDLMLPVMDGLEVARRIRKTSNVPIIILTAKDRVEDKVEGLDAGADDYLVKPFSIEELLALEVDDQVGDPDFAGDGRGYPAQVGTDAGQ